MSDDERAALVERIKAADDLIYSGKGVGAWEAINMHRDMLALLEADGKRLALAEKTIVFVRESGSEAGLSDRDFIAGVARAIIDYDAAKEAL